MNTVNVRWETASFGFLLRAMSQDRGLDRDREGRICARKEVLGCSLLYLNCRGKKMIPHKAPTLTIEVDELQKHSKWKLRAELKMSWPNAMVPACTWELKDHNNNSLTGMITVPNQNILHNKYQR